MTILIIIIVLIILGSSTGGNNKHKTGSWTQKTHLLRADEYICSNCGRSISKPRRTCPHCNAEIKKTKYDPSWVDEAEMMSALFDDDW